MKNKDVIARLQQLPPDAETYIEMIDNSAVVNSVDCIQVGEGQDAPNVVVLHTPHFYKFCKATGWCE